MQARCRIGPGRSRAPAESGREPNDSLGRRRTRSSASWVARDRLENPSSRATGSLRRRRLPGVRRPISSGVLSRTTAPPHPADAEEPRGESGTPVRRGPTGSRSVTVADEPMQRGLGVLAPRPPEVAAEAGDLDPRAPV